MKKIIAGIGSFFVFSMAFGQHAVHFTMGLQPNSRYDQSVHRK